LPPEWDANFRDLTLRNVRISDNVAYVATTEGIDIVDISDLEHPRILNHWPSGSTNDLKVFDVGGRRYVANVGDNLIVDVTEPTALRRVSMSDFTYVAHTLFAETRGGKSYLYFAELDGTASIYNVSDPTNPQHPGEFVTGASTVHGMVVDRGIPYINAWEEGLFRVDFTDPARPRETGHWAGTSHATSHSS